MFLCGPCDGGRLSHVSTLRDCLADLALTELPVRSTLLCSTAATRHFPFSTNGNSRMSFITNHSFKTASLPLFYLRGLSSSSQSGRTTRGPF